uniref:SH2 domain-containing protein n=1 Tax=Apteryx owenii TaxID=8824 RepID=A0A8B9PLL1_APTOW
LPRWYHDNLTRHAAEALLLSNGQDGSYLLRKNDLQVSFQGVNKNCLNMYF